MNRKEKWAARLAMARERQRDFRAARDEIIKTAKELIPELDVGDIQKIAEGGIGDMLDELKPRNLLNGIMRDGLKWLFRRL
jgi:hypothetical protein